MVRVDDNTVVLFGNMEDVMRIHQTAPAHASPLATRPGASEIGMRQRLALVAVKKHDVAGFGLPFAQLQAQADPL